MDPDKILDEELERTQGDPARSMNVDAARAVADLVRTTLGPKGMNKLLINDLGDMITTNNGYQILKETSVEHPAGRMIVEVTHPLHDRVGDGTTMATVLVGNLLLEAEKLIEDGLHPNTVVAGYQEAARMTRDVLDEAAVPVDSEDDMFESLLGTTMNGTTVGGTEDLLIEFVLEAFGRIAHAEGMPLDNVTVEGIVGGTVGDSKFVDGVLTMTNRVHGAMPDSVTDPEILLLDVPLEVDEPDATVQVDDVSIIERLRERDEARLDAMVDAIVDTGADVVFDLKGMDEHVQNALAHNGLFAARSVKRKDVERCSRATGAAIISDLHDLDADALGHAGLVEERTIGDEGCVVVEDCPDVQVGGIAIRGSSEQAVDDAELLVENGLRMLRRTVEDGAVLPGGGVPEALGAAELRSRASGVSGQEQLAVERFADALESVPRILAKNAGVDAVDALIELRNRIDAGERAVGITADGIVADVGERGVYEPLVVKREAITSATEAATMILRIDDVHLAELGCDHE